jgi:hypothetical protein
VDDCNNLILKDPLERYGPKEPDIPSKRDIITLENKIKYFHRYGPPPPRSYFNRRQKRLNKIPSKSTIHCPKIQKKT